MLQLQKRLIAQCLTIPLLKFFGRLRIGRPSPPLLLSSLLSFPSLLRFLCISNVAHLRILFISFILIFSPEILLKYFLKHPAPPKLDGESVGQQNPAPTVTHRDGNNNAFSSGLQSTASSTFCNLSNPWWPDEKASLRIISLLRGSSSASCLAAMNH